MADHRIADLDEVLDAAEFRRLLRRFEAHVDAHVRKAGLTPQRYMLLLAIKGAPDASETRSIGQLAEDLQLAQSSLTELVGRAETAGLVVRVAGTEDGRTVLVRLSPAGETRLATALAAVRGERTELLDRLDRIRRHLVE
jgi:DNA-binding MarR family transcriptional regulator